jgi:hypothetical protein
MWFPPPYITQGTLPSVLSALVDTLPTSVLLYPNNATDFMFFYINCYLFLMQREYAQLWVQAK